MARILAAVLVGLLVAPTAAADLVTPSETVRSRVLVRQQADRGSPAVGNMRPGQQAEHLGSRAGWHQVRLDDGTTGFVSGSWTRIIEVQVAIPAETIHPADIPQPRGTIFTSIGRFFGGLFRSDPVVDFDIREPVSEGPVYRHTDPNLPVAGSAWARGTGRNYDVVLVIDASSSTNEHAATDVDRDGRADDAWMGPDSIFRAQLSAAASFIRTLGRLPENADGKRIRVGLVTYSGDERYHLQPADRDLDAGSLLRLAERDAELQIALTSDYAAIEDKLAELWTGTPEGMTDVAAGIGRAVVELTGDRERGSRSEPREDAERVILFLTDGKPTLPYDKVPAERAASQAGKLAASAGIRIHAFALGYNAVSRSANYSLKRMARRSGGRHVELESPAEIVAVLQSTPLSVVERVQLVNRTTGHQSRHIATAIDGSFYGEVPLEQGSNEIEVAALLDDGSRASERFVVHYAQGLPTQELAAQLDEVRDENAALIERIHDDLAREMARARRRERQDRRLNVRVEPQDQQRQLELKVDQESEH